MSSTRGERHALPLPVARLALRSRNAKSSKDRHDTALYAWEVSMKLAVAAAPPADPSRLARGTIGTWASALRVPETPLAGGEVQALWELVAREGELPRANRAALTPRALLDGLVAYRNRVVHGGARDAAFHERAADTLLAALEPAWLAELFLPREAELLYCESIVLGADGSRLARLLDLSGPDALVADPRGSAVPAALLPRRLYLRLPTGWRELHPWLLYREGNAREREALYCFNGLGRTLAEYLDYASGETLRNEALEQDWPGIVGELGRLFPGSEARAAEPARAADAHRLGDYVVLGKLGQGGMGTVYLARQEPLGRLVALKTLSRERASDPVSAARFRQEIQALARSEHPSVVKILGSGEADGVWYYAMEYVEGADLERVARALSTSDDFGRAVTSACEAVRAERRELFEGLPEVRPAHVEGHRGPGRYQDLARYFRDAARGLHHLHEKGVLHRDVKPANLMVTAADRRAVVMDLGVAALEGGTISIAHDRSRIVGTLRYMAPEQLQRSLVTIDRRADVYALGASLYELLCDRPFHDGDTEARLIEQVLKEEPRAIDHRVPEDLARIVRKATDKDPARRYESAEAFALDLENFLAGLPVRARDPDLGYLARKWVERNRGLATAVAASTSLLVGTVAFYSVRLSAKNTDLGAANAALERKTLEAEKSATEAQLQAQLAETKADEVLRLSALQDLQELLAGAKELWPALPDNIDAYGQWIHDAQDQVSKLPSYRSIRAKVRALAPPGPAQSAAEHEAERRSHPAYRRLCELERELETAVQAAEAATDEEAARRAEARLTALEQEHDRMAARVEDRRDWTFPPDHPEARWWNEQLTKLIDGLEDLEIGLLAPDRTSAEHGWSMPKRLAFARSLQAGFAEGGEFALRWSAALPAIQAAYPGIELTPQLGLVPLGPDPRSGLWEFAQLQTGTPPERDQNGELVLDERMGLVFVLLPGGTFTMGARASDLRAWNDEKPPHDVSLSPFFLSKYEMTQGQWVRVAGANPSTSPVDLLHPVESVSWSDCVEILSRLGLELPSEAQWEYGARGGTETIWFCGDAPESIAFFGNVADDFAKRTNPDFGCYEAWDDGNVIHGRIGDYRPNPFGLHDAIGNVLEWCRDGYDRGFYARSPRQDPVAGVETPQRVVRGGCFQLMAHFATSAYRYSKTPKETRGDFGLRPARRVSD